MTLSICTFLLYTLKLPSFCIQTEVYVMIIVKMNEEKSGVRQRLELFRLKKKAILTGKYLLNVNNKGNRKISIDILLMSLLWTWSFALR